MKKNLRVLIVAILVLSLVLSLFAGCNNKTFQEKYGITLNDKTVTYDGNAYSVEISVDNAILGAKTYTVNYTYSKDGTALTETEFKDAGTYNVSASVLVAGEKEPTVLNAKLNINKYEVTIEMGNLFLRQGQGIASLGTPSYDAQLVGGDKFSSLGGLSYEVFQGSTKVTDLSTLKPTTKEADALSVQAIFTTAPKNYDVKFTNGKLYVLSGADYDVASKLKTYINGAPTTNTINTFTYSEMKDFVSAADYILEKYPSTSAIQRLMSGTVSTDTISTLLKTAKSRLTTVYDIEFDIDSAVGSMTYVGVNHVNNDTRLTTDDDYISDFGPTKSSAIKTAEYGDIIGFTFTLADKTKYKFTGLTIRNKTYTWVELSALGATETAGTGNALVYTFGVANDTAPNSHYGSANKGLQSGKGSITINNTVLGALDGKGYITITPQVSEIYTIELAGKTSGTNVTGGSSGNMATEAPNLSYVTLSSKGTVYRDLSATTTEVKYPIPTGSLCKLTIYPKTGYIISEVELGDKIVKGEDFVNNSYEFTIDDSYVNTSKVMTIKVTLMEAYSLKVYVNNKIISNTTKTNIYKTAEGTVTLENVSATTVPTINGESTLKLFAVPAENYILTSLTLKGKKTTSDTQNDKTLNYTTDAKESASGLVEIDFGTGAAALFDSSAEVTVYAVFTKVFPVVVKSGMYGDDANTVMTYNNGVYSSKYGTVQIVSGDKQDTMNNLYEGQKYFISLTSESGYVPKTVKVYNTSSGTTLYTFTIENSESYRYRMINDSSAEIYVGQNASANDINIPTNMTAVNATQDIVNNALTLAAGNLSAGSDLVIEVTYEAYYWVSYTLSKPSSEDGATISIQGYLGANNVYTTTGAPAGHEINTSSGVIKVGTTGTSYYMYYKAGTSTGAKILFKITPISTHKIENVEGYIGSYELPENTYSSEKTYSTSLEDAINGDYTNAKVKPGETIEVYFTATFSTIS